MFGKAFHGLGNDLPHLRRKSVIANINFHPQKTHSISYILSTKKHPPLQEIRQTSHIDPSIENEHFSRERTDKRLAHTHTQRQVSEKTFSPTHGSRRVPPSPTRRSFSNTEPGRNQGASRGFSVIVSERKMCTCRRGSELTKTLNRKVNENNQNCDNNSNG